MTILEFISICYSNFYTSNKLFLLYTSILIDTSVSFDGTVGVNMNVSQQSEVLTDFSRSSNSTTYQVSTEGMENSLMHENMGELNLQREPDSFNGKNDPEGNKFPSKQKEEIAWIDYHPPPKDNDKGNIYKM